jgi:hypothetical protein
MWTAVVNRNEVHVEIRLIKSGNTYYSVPKLLLSPLGSKTLKVILLLLVSFLAYSSTPKMEVRSAQLAACFCWFPP